MAKSKGRLLSELAEAPKNEDYADVNALPNTGNKVGDQAFVEETSRLYIWNGSGWYNIALINTAPSITSNHDSSYNLSYNTPLNISVSATDPEGLNLNYSYNTSDSIGNVATITNDSSQFTITPSNNYAVEGTFSLAFRASDGVNIATAGTSTFTLANQAPSLSGNSASYVLATDGSTPTVITLTSVDPEGQPITYTATGDSGFNAIATVSNDSSVFTITPKSEDSAATGTGTLTFTASDGIKSTSAPSSFTLSFISIIENNRYTTLLATATGTSDNSNITDASPNNHTITISGDTYAGTFSPYRSGGYSTYFDHTDRVYLTNDMSAALGTSGFSMEAWIYRTTTDSDENVIVNGPGNDNGWGLAISSGKIRARFHNTNLISGATTVSPNEWHHVMIAKTASNELLIFLDGTLDARSTSSSINYNATSTTLTVGSYADRTQLVSYGFNGYIRDARVIVGYGTFPYGSYGTSVGTNYFTPPSEPLTAVSGTEALLCGLPYHGDLSSNNHSVSETGGAVTKPFSPYDYNEYSAADNGGSVHFDGSVDNLQTANTISLSGDFTVSAWVYLQGSSKGIIFGSNYPPNFQFFIESSNVIGFYDGSTENGTGEIQRDIWNYCVWTRSGSTVSMYINGESSGSATSTSTFQIKFVGSLGGIHDLVNGYISDAQVKTTSTSAANAVPPTAPLSSTGTELHIKGTDASIIDKSQGTNLKLVGNTTGSTTQVKFASSKSMYFDGTGDYILSQEPVKLGTQDFTAECWLYYESGLELMGNRTVSDSGGFSVRISSTTLTVGNSSGTGFGSVFSGTTSSLTNAWHHIAVSRSSGVTKIYVDGTSIASHSNSIDFSLSNPFVIGYAYTNGSGADPIQGYIQDFRVTTGLARYTANFTPPTASLEG